MKALAVYTTIIVAAVAALSMAAPKQNHTPKIITDYTARMEASTGQSIN